MEVFFCINYNLSIYLLIERKCTMLTALFVKKRKKKKETSTVILTSPSFKSN